MGHSNIGDAFAPAIERQRIEVIAQTFGHLEPKWGTIYPCKLIFTLTEWGNFEPISSDFGPDLDMSPGLFGDINDFICKKAKDYGGIYKFEGTFHLLKNGLGRFSGKTRKVKL